QNSRRDGASGREVTAARKTAYVASGYLLIGLLAVLAGLLLGLAAVKPPAPQSAATASDGFSAEAALPLVLDLLGDSGPHPIGTDANAAVRGRLIAELENIGLEVTTQEAFACRERWLVCGHVVNVI